MYKPNARAERFRITDGSAYSSNPGDLEGCFRLPKGLTVIASNGMGWEHASVSMPRRTPTWKEMCQVKEMFWGDEDVVIQIHPKKSDYINNSPNCLHLFRKAGTDEFVELPPSIMVGFKELNQND